MTTLVMKFGGSALGMTAGLTQMLSIVLYERERWSRLLLVVSALDGVTDQLIEAARLAELDQRRGYRRIVATLRQRHLTLIEHLPLGQTERTALQADLDRLLFDLLDVCENLAGEKIAASRRHEAVDAIIGVGERLAARIVAALIRQKGLRGVALDATSLIITNNVYGNATPNLDLTRERLVQELTPLQERQIIPVITGFIGSTQTGKPTTLGRGGSDYTASIVAASIGADEVCIWTDVDGMMSADPHEISAARVIPTLSYDETAELAYFGARLLHTRMIGPLRERRIPLRIRNVFRPQAIGTRISDDPAPPRSQVKAVTSIPALVCSAPLGGSLHGVAAIVDGELSALTGIHAEIMIPLQTPVSSLAAFVIPTSAGIDALHTLLESVQARLTEQHFTGWTARPGSVITLVGARLTDQPTLLGDMLVRLATAGIAVLAVRGGHGTYGLSVVVEPVHTDAALTTLHALTA